MALNWRDIQDRTITFVHNYKDAKDEDRDAKPFWKDLFALFNIDPRTIGSFEERVRMHGRPGTGKMDYFAPRRFLIEQKSRGKDMEVAYKQAMDYFDALSEEEKPRYIIISDFEQFHIYDLEEKGKKRKTEILLSTLPKHIKKFSFLADEEVSDLAEESAINVKAVRAVGRLHHALRDAKYPLEDLSPLLTRLVFIFFADDTGIFDKNSLRQYISQNTKEDGSDIGAQLGLIFDILNTSEDERQTTVHETLLALPYVNGGLFAQSIKPVFGTREIRDTLMECFAFDWSGVSPAIFGSMFQSVMDEKERHDLGAHYTSEKNILKVIEPLFLNSLKEDLEKAKSEEKLRHLWGKLASITLLDPACGCGNFLVISYRELRRIEIEIIKRLDKGRKGFVEKVEAGQAHLGLEMDLANLSKMSVERMYGIEYESFPAEVAKLSLWLMDHMMNMELGSYYGKPLRKLPLTEAPHIVKGNALRINWEDIVPKTTLTHILGNPPFLGKKEQNDEQKEDMSLVWGGAKGTGLLDYVSAWYKKAADFIEGTHISCAFVSTNSISQGEQVGVLWSYLFSKSIKIHFAHRTFKWSNEASGKAAVHCVIVGFGLDDVKGKKIFDYPNISGDPLETSADNINPYLVDAPDILVAGRSKPLSSLAPIASYGSFALDDSVYTLSSEERNSLLGECSTAEKFIRPFIGGRELLHSEERYCLWLRDASPVEIKSCPSILSKVEAVKRWRLTSNRATTKKLAATPYLFAEIRQPQTDYIAFPTVSSENREYIPISVLPHSTIASNQIYVIPTSDLFVFGILTSTMHNAWIRGVCGRLKSDFRYSIAIVYNTFPWPEAVNVDSKKLVQIGAQKIIDIRNEFKGVSLADLYNPNTMPKKLWDAHKELDRFVDACYGKQRFSSEPERLEFLFQLYQTQVTQEMLASMKKGPKASAIQA